MGYGIVLPTLYRQLLGGLEHLDDFPFSWEFHHPN
jgi:hypothetical protein